MHMQRDLHPTLLSSLEGIVDQMVWFRENWHEEVKIYLIFINFFIFIKPLKYHHNTLNFDDLYLLSVTGFKTALPGLNQMLFRCV